MKQETVNLASTDRGGPAQPLLMIKDLKKYFPVRGELFQRERKFVHAVDGVSFSVAKGKTLGIVGESGCGKSTTARLIARLVTPDSGSMIFDGKAWRNLVASNSRNSVAICKWCFRIPSHR